MKLKVVAYSFVYSGIFNEGKAGRCHFKDLNVLMTLLLR